MIKFVISVWSLLWLILCLLPSDYMFSLGYEKLREVCGVVELYFNTFIATNSGVALINVMSSWNVVQIQPGSAGASSSTKMKWHHSLYNTS